MPFVFFLKNPSSYEIRTDKDSQQQQQQSLQTWNIDVFVQAIQELVSNCID